MLVGDAGVNGVRMLAVYGVASAVVIAVALVRRVGVLRGGGVGRPPTPSELAYLNGGPARAVHSALAGLRAFRAIDTGAPRTLRAIGPHPPGATELEQAVYDAADRHRPAHGLRDDPGVAAALVALRADLVRAGWLASAEQRRRARSGGSLVLGLALLGGLRIPASVEGSRPGLVLLTIATAAVGAALLVVGPRTIAGRRAVAAARRVHPVAPIVPWSGGHRASADSTATPPAIGVALYGTAALWAADPVFAAEAGIERFPTGTASYGYGGAFESTVSTG